MSKTLSYDNYLRLVGLLTLAADHRKMLEAIDKSACAITGDEPLGHTSDAVWGESTTERLLEKLGITVPALEDVQQPVIDTTSERIKLRGFEG